MESKLMINSIGIGGAFFVGIIVFWFIFVYLKKRMIADQPNPGYSTATEISWAEKRQHPRVAIAWPAFLEKSQHNQEIQLKDISLGGAFVTCQEPLALQEKFKITFHLPAMRNKQYLT